MEKYTTEQLKGIAYDLLRNINNLQGQLQAVEQEINKRADEQAPKKKK